MRCWCLIYVYELISELATPDGNEHMTGGTCGSDFTHCGGLCAREGIWWAPQIMLVSNGMMMAWNGTERAKQCEDAEKEHY